MWKLFLFLTSSLATIQDCSKTNSLLKITALDLIPANPIVNEPVVMVLQFNNPGPDVVAGKATTAINYNFIQIAPIVEDLCVSTPCPLTVGFNDRSTNSTWPDSLKGTVTSKIVWTSVDQQVLLCIQISLKSSDRKNLR
jgi:hypothetical protein